jgi:hypothetical protein
MRSDPPPIRAWFARIPDPILILILGALLHFARSIESRMTASEYREQARDGRIEAIRADVEVIKQAVVGTFAER